MVFVLKEKLNGFENPISVGLKMCVCVRGLIVKRWRIEKKCLMSFCIFLRSMNQVLLKYQGQNGFENVTQTQK
jgi:hypothetical protein